jgi:hypothetical protein
VTAVGSMGSIGQGAITTAEKVVKAMPKG